MCAGTAISHGTTRTGLSETVKTADIRFPAESVATTRICNVTTFAPPLGRSEGAVPLNCPVTGSKWIHEGNALPSARVALKVRLVAGSPVLVAKALLMLKLKAEPGSTD